MAAMPWFIIVVVLLILVIATPIALWWWKLVDKAAPYADKGRGRKKPKAEGPTEVIISPPTGQTNPPTRNAP
jgi:hypothetical protein